MFTVESASVLADSYLEKGGEFRLRSLYLRTVMKSYFWGNLSNTSWVISHIVHLALEKAQW